MPPELPTKPTSSISTGTSLSMHPDIKRVESLSGYALQRLGWKHEKGNSYTKGALTIIFDGTFWNINGEKINFTHQLPENK